MAPLAPDLVALLQNCGQRVDPLLLELAAASGAQTAGTPDAAADLESSQAPRKHEREGKAGKANGVSEQMDDDEKKDDDEEEEEEEEKEEEEEED